MLAGFMLAGMFACSGNDLEQIESSEEDFASRTALVTQTVTLTETTDSLGLILEEQMGDEVSTLQKLVVSGPFTAADMGYICDSLTNLEELDLKDAQIKASEETYDNWYTVSFEEDNVIADYMFRNMDNLKTVILPSTITSIGFHAFEYCEALNSVVIPSSVTSIGSYAFYDCDALSSIEIPSSVTTIENHTFYDCDGLVSVQLNQGLKVIEDYAFLSCSALTSIKLPEGLEQINLQAFAYCALTNVEIPSSVTTMGREIFYQSETLTSVSIKANLTKLPESTFYGCTALETVELPSTIETIGSYAFEGCSKFTDNTLFANVKTLENYAFCGCGFTELDLSGIETLGNWVLSSCKNLQSVVLPDNLTELPGGTFADCESLTNISLPSTLETIGASAFDGSGLTSIEIPANVRTIEYDAFSHTNLKELTIPSTVTEVGGSFVSYCDNLMAVYWNSSIEVPYSYGVDGCFLYLSSGNTAYATSYWTNVIFDGVAENIVLNSAGYRSEHAYGCLKAFTAKKITYKRNFSQMTYPGESAGWLTIVLPFKPTTISHETKGVIAPFNSNVEGAKPFWLRELTSEGWKDVTAIEANKAYIIAMPNNSDYLEDYRLEGMISFSAENVEIGVTPETLEASVGPEYEFQPTYQKVAKAANVYALNVGKYVDGANYIGSVFARSTDDVKPYEAYVKTLGGGRSATSVYSTDTRSTSTRAAWQRNTTGIPQIGDM